MNKLILISLIVLCFSIGAYAQSIAVSGVVSLEEDNFPLIGATVVEKGTTNGTQTDIDGKFLLEVESKDAILEVSFIGMKTEEIPLDGRTQFTISLSENYSTLDEIVVMGYGTQTRSKISGAVSSVSEEQIKSTSITRVEQTLQGRTPGVNVIQNSGSPGSTLQVRIRGIGTINNSDPLYVVDGFIVGGIDYLNPGDIESINVLKDAASAAIYGAGAANGVVLITTKQGRIEQTPTITYNMYYGVQKPWKKQNLLSAEQYAILSNEAHLADGRTPLPEFSDPASLGEGTDWQDAIYETAPIQNHQISIVGGSKLSTYAVNGSHFSQDGIVGGEKSRFKRSTFRVNNSHQIFDKLKIGNILSYTHIKRNGLSENNEFNSPIIRALNMDPVTPIRKPDGTFAYSQYSDTDITNPVNALELTNDLWTTNRLVGTIYGELEIIKGLKFRPTFNLDVSLGTRDVFNPSFDLSDDPVLSDAPAGEKRLINNVLQEDNKYFQWLSENTLTYKKTFRDKHDFTALAGFSIKEWQHVYHGGTKSDLRTNDPELAVIDNGQDAESAISWGGKSDFAEISYFGRLNYEFNNKYLFSVVGRYDGSSRFGDNNKFGFFPSFSAGWVISQERFMQNIDLISFLKLRASWGTNGNREIGNYEFAAPVFAGQNYTFGTDEVITNGSGPIKVSNPDLRWETSIQSNIGIDLELLDGKFNLATDYFIKNTTDMLAPAPIAGFIGLDATTRNVGNGLNKGWELAVEYQNRDRPFKYALGGNITFVKNEITSLGEGGDPISANFLQSASGNITRSEVGFPMFMFYGYETDGLFQNQAELEQHAEQSGAQPGDIRFKDLNNDGVINQDDQTFIGNPFPKFTYGFNGKLEFKGVDLSFFLLGVSGNDIYNGTVRYDFTYVNRPVSELERWTGEGTSTTVPRTTLSDPNQNARISDRFVEDGSFLRLKNLQLGYNLPKEWLKRMKTKEFRVYISAQNLFTFTKYSGLDPEIGGGIDRGFYQQSRTYLGGLSIQF